MSNVPPLDLHIALQRPRVVAGQSIMIDISHVVRVDLEMEPVALNDWRTQVILTSLRDPAQVEVLTGDDHRRIHHAPHLKPLGRPFHAAAGSAWTTELDVLNYRVPLPAGSYRVEIAYRHGATLEESVRSNPVDFEVVEVGTLAISDRWFGESKARALLGSLWVAREGGSVRWLYRVANSHDPEVVSACTDLDAAPAAVAPPVLAHLNDIASLHFERFAVWLEAGTIGWMAIADRTRITGPRALPHGLSAQPPPRVIDPPLHLRSGGLAALVAGVAAQSGRPTLFLAQIDSEEAPARGLSRTLDEPLPEHCVVVWSSTEEPLTGTLFAANTPDSRGVSRIVSTDLGGASPHELLSTTDKILALVADQWLGMGRVLALLRGTDAFRVMAWDPERLAPDAQASIDYRFEAIVTPRDPPEPVPDPMDIVALPYGLGLLFRGQTEWIVMTPRGRWSLRFEEAPSAGVPRLVASSGGVFVVFPDAERGFVERSTEPASVAPREEED